MTWCRQEGGGCTRVFEREDDEHQEYACDELAEELAGLCHKGLWVCAEGAGCGVGRGRYGAQVVPLEVVDGGDVVGVHDARPDQAAEDLGGEVDGEAAPGELPEETVAEGYGGVEVCARVASDVDSEHDSKAPAVFCQFLVRVSGGEDSIPPVDGLIRSESVSTWCCLLTCAEHHLGHRAVPKHHHVCYAPELCKWFS